MRAAYRFQQGLRALGAWFRPVEDDLAREYLPPALFALYSTMRRSERQHSLRVLCDLLDQGYSDRDLLIAALLHDVGKTCARFSIPEKVLVVLVKAFAPDRYYCWGSQSAQGWRRPFAVSVQHPAWGAQMVGDAGGPPRTVDLIRRHADPLPESANTTSDRLLRALQNADNRN